MHSWIVHTPFTIVIFLAKYCIMLFIYHANLSGLAQILLAQTLPKGRRCQKKSI
jgi:hypothetical protein